MDLILKNPTSKLLFVTAELYQSREIDENQKRSLKGKKNKWCNTGCYRAHIHE